MSIHRHLFRRQAEATPVVTPVLEALRAPARASELRREDATVAAFHSARLTPPTSTRSDMSITARSAATRAAIATGVVVALSTGGFALAATDHLPTLPDQASDQATESVAKNRATSAPTTEATTATTTATTTTEAATEATETETETEAATPTPNFEGLCNAFQHHKKLDGKYLDSAAFTALATAAGSKAGIAAYCVALIGEPTVKPAKPAKPTKEAKPTKAPKTDKVKPTPTNKPTTKPTPAVKGKSAGKGKANESGKPATAGTR